MSESTFLETFIQKVDAIREDEFSKNSFNYVEPVMEKKVLNEKIYHYFFHICHYNLFYRSFR